MSIQKLLVKNFKVLRDTTIELNRHLNIIVGDNEAGKSTLLEAIHLAMSCQINGRHIRYELTPHFFNDTAVKEYLANLKATGRAQPPSILIEAYLDDDPSLARFKGTNNTLRENCPGLILRIEFDEEYSAEYSEYIQNPDDLKTVPVEYYAIRWYSFAHNPITGRSAPIKTVFIDTGLLRSASGAGKYISTIVDNVLDPRQKVELSLSYRRLRDVFLQQPNVQKINTHLASKKGDVTDKDLSVSMDMSQRSAWESTLVPHLNDIPIALSGRGEQSAVNMKLAVEGAAGTHIVLIEEPENHQSYSNMSKLVGKIGEKTAEQQIVIATHSSFVLNKLGVGNVILFNRDSCAKLDSLSTDTRNYFMKLPGHDTLRLILSEKAILVEGPSDELIVQKAFYEQHGAMPLDRGVDVIAVQSLAFKRFLEIALLLELEVRVVTDNDGDVAKLRKKYKQYDGLPNISICYDEDEDYRTLEPQLLKVNSLATLNQALGKDYGDESALLSYMESNKTDYALKLFSATRKINFPAYIQNAIN